MPKNWLTTHGSLPRSAASSLVATSSDFIAAALLVALGAAVSVATFSGCVVGGLVAFGLNRAWAFQSRGRTRSELVRFALVWAGSALLNAGGVSTVARLGVPFSGSWLAVRVGVYLFWNYPLLRWFVFEPAKAEARVR